MAIHTLVPPMLLLDTQVWIWWTTGSPDLPSSYGTIEAAEPDGLAMSAFTAWEAAMLERRGRIDLGGPVREWLGAVRSLPTLHIITLSPEILIESVELPAPFHADPADRIIVATARHLGCAILTTDARILAYPHVQLAQPA